MFLRFKWSTLIPNELLEKFYRNVFSLAQLFRIIDPSTFSHREFGFLLVRNGKEIFTRNKSFDVPEHLLHYVRVELPQGIMVGGIYDPPPRGQSITKLKWLGHELIFDLDLTDYDDVRTCGKGKDHVCPKCWPLIRDAALFIDETLREDFGFQKITWVFSGRRGLHAWITDPEVLMLDEEARDAIVEWIAPQGERILRPYYWQERALKIFSNIKSLESMYSVDIAAKKKIAKIWEEVRKRLPRIDRQVTIDINRLLRMPGSIHPATGRLVMIVRDLQTFYVDDAPTIYELVG